MESRMVGRYQILSELARGGMATVYRALAPRFNRQVADKILPPQFTHEPMFRARSGEQVAESKFYVQSPNCAP